ncbi:MAG: endolytic transglycosylase MltG [Clostridia bacterium]|jgi:UPF0755 protein|nr:endolytic transglycosylase MltG [Clostridia bacterium]MBQ4364960.1 endolytic transglycosylase MltG [Clostridia bacterium]
MDENRYPQDNQKTPASGFDAYPAPRPRTSKFKVNIDGLDNEPPVYIPTNPVRTQPARQAPATGRPVNDAARRANAAARPTQTAQSAAKQTPPARPKVQTQKKKRKKSKLQKERRKYKLIRGTLITLVCIICIAIVTATVSTMALSTINDILALNKEGSGVTVAVEIPEKADFDQVYDILCDNGLVKQKFLCKLFCKFRHYDKIYSKSQKKEVFIQYEPGVYYFETSNGIEEMLEQIKVSNHVARDTIRLTFPEGWTIAKIFERIEKYNVCTAEKLYANLDIVGKQFGFYAKIKAPNGRYLKAEGYVFPDTYDFYIGEQASSVLKKLFTNFQSKWTKEFSLRAKELHMTRDQVITLASIIQREAKDSKEMPTVSSVLHNRLNHPELYPQLQMNSTKEYVDAVNEYGLFNEVYYSIYLDAYNTYSVTGLPAGPICNPGLSAIKAALYPSDTNYFFFCHDADGNIYLAETAEEHQRNTEKILFD